MSEWVAVPCPCHECKCQARVAQRGNMKADRCWWCRNSLHYMKPEILEVIQDGFHRYPRENYGERIRRRRERRRPLGEGTKGT